MEELILALRAITGINSSKAANLLNNTNGNLDKAVHIYMKELDIIDINNEYNKENIKLDTIPEIYEDHIFLDNENYNILVSNDENTILEYKLDFNMSLFDKHCSNSFKSNLNYMKMKYGFNIPYNDCLINIHSLFEYLHKQVYLLKSCINCNKKFLSTESCCHHMLDKGHCQINLGLIDNIEKYYDLTDIRDIFIEENTDDIDTDLILPNNKLAINKNTINYHNKKNIIEIHSKKNVDQILAQQLARKECLKNFDILNTGMMHNKKAIPSQFCHKKNTSFNKHTYAEKHHRGLGGGGSHFWLAATKQQLKGVKIKNIKQRRGGTVASKNHQSGKQES
jgi:hypothetical protein